MPHAEPQREMLSLVTAKVRDTYVRKPFYIDGHLDLISACRLMSENKTTHALVRDVGPDGQQRLGIFTTTDLRDALLRTQPPGQLAVREASRFELLEVESDSELFEALWLMVRHRVHRLLVRDGDSVVGVLSQLDLVSFVANHSHIVALQIDDAKTVDDLKDAAARVDQMVELLHGSGIRIERITRLVSELNTRLFAKAWSLVAPPELIANSCLMVMGSEGRAEQILKTDQDNALLLRDGFEFAGLTDVTRRFSEMLTAFGYPPCPGDIMVTNPVWCQPLSKFKDDVRVWLYGENGRFDPEGPMRLAIFFDAAAVAGDKSLLDEALNYLYRNLAGNDMYLARFAGAADQFNEPGNWFTRLATKRDEQLMDLKKLGTFPIVHGVRALSLQYGVREQGTAARLDKLVAMKRIEPELARDLIDALRFLMGLRLSHQLKQRAGGARPGNEVKASDLGVLEREPLRDSFDIVKRFRLFLRQHFKFGSL